VTNDQQGNSSDVESNLVDSILYDIRSGFPHKKSFDKVCVINLNKSFEYLFYTILFVFIRRVRDHIMRQL